MIYSRSYILQLILENVHSPGKFLVNIEMICTMSVLENKFSRMMKDENKNRHRQSTAMIWCSPAQRAKKGTVGGIVCRIQDLKARPTREIPLLPRSELSTAFTIIIIYKCSDHSMLAVSVCVSWHGSLDYSRSSP